MTEEIEATLAQTPSTEALAVINRLGTLYSKLLPTKSKDDFFNAPFMTMFKDESKNGAAVEERFYEIISRENLPDDYPLIFEFMLVPCAYCVDAIRADLKGERDRAWSFVCKASYLDGAIASRVITTDEMSSPIKKMAASGARARDAKFDPLRAMARDLASKKTFPSRRNAAKNIAPQIIALSESLRINLSSDQAEITISKWLKDMSFAGKRSI